MSQDKLSILFPYSDRISYRLMPEETWHDLGLDAVAEKVARQPQEAALIKRVMTSLTPDPRVSAFRADVFEDILRHPQVRDRLMKLLDKVKMFYDYGAANRHSEEAPSLWDLLHRLEEYRDYILTVEAIRECLDGKELRSQGLKKLKDEVDGIYQDQGFAALKQDVEAMRLTADQVKSVTVGINVNERFEAVSMGLVAVNARPFTRSGLIKNFVSAVSGRDALRQDPEDVPSQSYYPAEGGEKSLEGAERLAQTSMMLRNPLIGLAMIPQDDGSSRVTRQMDSAAGMLLSRLVRKLRETLAKHLNVSIRNICDLIPELLFYVRWAEHIEGLQRKGWPFCKPQALQDATESPGMEARGFWNLKLIGALSPEQAVPNDLDFDAEKRVYILTGANRGGKTTVTQAVGQLFLLAQSGISVPARSFAFHPADQVLTHFPADEDRTADLGRLGEECQRFKSLYALLSSHSLLLLNETFSTTSFEEGFTIAVDAIRAVLRKGARTVYNTHMHKLAFSLDDQINPDPEGALNGRKACSLVVESPGGKPSFKVRVAPPSGKSYARSIAEKYGVTYEQLTEG